MWNPCGWVFVPLFLCFWPPVLLVCNAISYQDHSSTNVFPVLIMQFDEGMIGAGLMGYNSVLTGLACAVFLNDGM